jgi:hypothetical protein
MKAPPLVVIGLSHGELLLTLLPSNFQAFAQERREYLLF